MACASCGFENREGTRFCVECGLTIGAAALPEIDNAAIGVVRTTRRLLTDRRVDDVRYFLHDDLVVRSERWHGPPPQTADEYTDSFRVLREQYESFRVEPMAVRGDRLSVHLDHLTDGGGDELVVAQAVEVDADGLVISAFSFDGEDVVSAVARIDGWFAAGEGAEHVAALSATAAWFEAINRFDFDAMRDLAAPGFVFVDHRQLGLGTVGVDGFVSWQQEYVDLDFAAVVTHIRFRGRAALTTAINGVFNAGGAEVLWSFHTIGVLDDHGLTERIELFDTDDWAAAEARLDELAG